MNKRRQEAQDVSAFGSLTAAPTDWGSIGSSGSSATLRLPANARIGLVFDAPIDAAVFTLDVNDGETLYHNPALPNAGQVWVLDRVEKDRVIKVSRSAAALTGHLAIAVIDSIGRVLTFATVTFI